MKPFSQACENNKQPILHVLQHYLIGHQSVFEVASGTGQHAVHFSQNLPEVTWQPTEQKQCMSGLLAWVNESSLPNILQPMVLDVDYDWPEASYDAVFSANTVHIISWKQVQVMLEKCASLLGKQGLLFLYGPFNYHGRFTSASNANFDQWLKARDIQSGIRDFEAINEQAELHGFSLLEDHEMPANNRILVWEKTQDFP